MNTGTIKKIHTVPGSGGITIELEDGTSLFADNGPTIRALDNMFGDVILPGHQFNIDAVIGKTISYEVADWGGTEWIDLPFSEETVFTLNFSTPTISEEEDLISLSEWLLDSLAQGELLSKFEKTTRRNYERNDDTPNIEAQI